MTTTTKQPPTRTPRTSEDLRLVLGVVLLVMGLAVLRAPGATLLVVGLLFGVQLLVAGLLRLTLALRTDASSGRRLLLTALAGLTAVAGIVCVFQPATSLLMLVLTVAVGWASDGAAELVRGASVRLPVGHRAALLTLGVASVACAVLLVASPGTSLLVITRLGGVSLLLLGAGTVVTAARVWR